MCHFYRKRCEQGGSLSCRPRSPQGEWSDPATRDGCSIPGHCALSAALDQSMQQGRRMLSRSQPASGDCRIPIGAPGTPFVSLIRYVPVFTTLMADAMPPRVIAFPATSEPSVFPTIPRLFSLCNTGVCTRLMHAQRAPCFVVENHLDIETDMGSPEKVISSIIAVSLT